MGGSASRANFGFLDRYDPALVQIAGLAERYFPDDPVTSIIKCRQFCELLAQEIAARVGVLPAKGEAQIDLLGRLGREYNLPREALQFLHFVRKVGNAANHDRTGDHATALSALKVAWQLSVWFHRSFGDHGFKSGPFQPPKAPADPTIALREELERLRAEHQHALSEVQRKASDAEERAAFAEAERLSAEQRSIKEAEERAFWEQYAAEAGAEAIAKLEALQRETASLPQATIRKRRAAVEAAASKLTVDEKATRSIIDAQLRNCGWEADSELALLKQRRSTH